MWICKERFAISDYVSERQLLNPSIRFTNFPNRIGPYPVNG